MTTTHPSSPTPTAVALASATVAATASILTLNLSVTLFAPTTLASALASALGPTAHNLTLALYGLLLSLALDPTDSAP